MAPDARALSAGNQPQGATLDMIGSGTDVGSPDLLRAKPPLVSRSIQPQTMIYAKRMAVELTQSATWPE